MQGTHACDEGVGIKRRLRRNPEQTWKGARAIVVVPKVYPMGITPLKRRGPNMDLQDWTYTMDMREMRARKGKILIEDMTKEQLERGKLEIECAARIMVVIERFPRGAKRQRLKQGARALIAELFEPEVVDGDSV
jgi:hypothetical protein